MECVKIQSVADASFGKYGKVLKEYDCTELIEKMKQTPVTEDVVYAASVKELEELAIAGDFRNRMYGGMPIQIGYCNGKNKRLNALEYHRNSEVNAAVTDMILLVGSQQDIREDFTYDTSLVEAFLVPAGTVVEMYATTLHYAPCSVAENGFRCTVILPKNTNTELDFPVRQEGEERLLTAKNKWLIAHRDAEIEGAFCGLKGENIELD